MRTRWPGSKARRFGCSSSWASSFVTIRMRCGGGGRRGRRWRARASVAPELVRRLLASAPAEFTQVARNPQRSVRIGGRHQVFAPVYGSPFVRDLEGGRRYGSLADFQRLVKLTHQLQPLHHSGFVTCEPCDIPVSKRHLDMLFAHMTLTDKPHLGAITEKSRAQDSVAMARLLHGDEVFD